ncbi:hypothetical protein ACUR5C_00135 [Aliikangiella sp. IMCC44653]
MSFEQTELLNRSPLGILVCDPQHRIIWCNQKFMEDTQIESAQILNQLYAALPIEAIDNDAHTVQLFDSEAKLEVKFQYWSDTLDTPNGHTVHYFAKEREAPSKLALSSAKLTTTRIPKKNNWVDFLDYEVSRSRRYDNPLSIMKLHLLVFNKPDSVANETLHQTIKDTLTNELRWADMIGHTDNSTYLMILPETPESALPALKTKLKQALSKQLAFINSSIDYQLVFGETHWQTHDDSQKMLAKARHKLVAQLETLLKDEKALK